LSVTEVSFQIAAASSSFEISVSALKHQATAQYVELIVSEEISNRWRLADGQFSPPAIDLNCF